LAALLLGDRTSFVNANPGFAPLPQFTHNGTFGLAELINVALGRPNQAPAGGTAATAPPPMSTPVATGTMSTPAATAPSPVSAGVVQARRRRRGSNTTARDQSQKGIGETLMSFTETDALIKTIKDEVKLALVRAIARGAERVDSVEDCVALNDLAQAFNLLPVMGDLPDFVHTHGGVPFPPTGGGTTAGGGTSGGGGTTMHTHGAAAPASSGSAASAGVGSHASAPGVADMPAGDQSALDELLSAAGIDPNVAPDPTGATTPDVTTGAGTGTTTTTPPPTPVTPAQMRLEQAVEDARIALADALSKLAKSPLDNHKCLLLLADALNTLPIPNPDTTGGGGGGGGGMHTHGTPAPTPTPPPMHSHGSPAPTPPPPPPVQTHGGPGHSHGF
jgi:hypothetical protein